MLRKILIGVESVLFLLLGFKEARAVELEKRPFLYTQDFEENDPVKFWGTNGEYTVNFKNLTEEKAFSGKKSLEEAEKELQSLTNLSSEAEKMKEETKTKISSFKAKVVTVKGESHISLSTQKAIDHFVEQLKNIIFNIKAISNI